MKRFSILFVFLVGAILTFAQVNTILMFEQFSVSTIKFKNKSLTKVLANYDMGQQRMLYKQNDVVMELVGTAAVDTVCFGPRKFIPYGDSFLEIVNLKDGTVYINWHQKSVNIGSKGAFGAVTQGTVKPLYIFDLGLNSPEMYNSYNKQNVNNTDVYKQKNDNEYMLRLDDKFVKFRNVKQLCKLFPDKASLINKFVKQHKIEFKYVEDVLMLMNYCMSVGSH